MAKKKVAKKKGEVVLTEDEKEELKAEGELPKKSVVKDEERQLVWFIVIIGVVFVAFLIPYFTIEGAKTFEYGGVDWAIEEYAEPTGDIYHGRFSPAVTPDLTFNVYLRGDPRENFVETVGVFDKFKGGGIISLTPEVDACRGELTRAMFDLTSFLEQGIGVGSIAVGYTDRSFAVERGKRYALCDNVNDRVLVIVDIGESRVVQDEKNPYCYTIYAESCNDVSSVEKFILKSIDDFNEAE